MRRRRLFKFLALPAADRRLLLRALVVMTGVWVTLRFRAWPAAELRLGRRTRVGAPRDPARAVPIARLRWAVLTVTQAVFPASCLVQALALQILLARHGWPSQLRLGVSSASGAPFGAHAWLECDGAVVIGAAPAGFTPLPVPRDRPLFGRPRHDDPS
ncbi:MAG TPA: lasso peptide biosynthesis B2 protein [Vicinamibacterales bacterium]|nr:lasso peptide biosynthesis B2 protein [Vicinamibacterales bacterium]